MKRWKNTAEKMFMAGAFAEAGEWAAALDPADVRSGDSRIRITRWDRVFAAVAFAESGCPEQASSFMENRSPGVKDVVPPGLMDFLHNVGLQGIRISYGTAPA